MEKLVSLASSASPLRPESEARRVSLSQALPPPDACIQFIEVSRQHHAKQLLLVEDQAFVREVTCEVLRSAGFSVIGAGNASEALRACRDSLTPMDLLLADVVMPGMSGLDLAAQFETMFPDSCVLLVTGYPELIARSEMSEPTRQYLIKPYSRATLSKKVHEVLEAKIMIEIGSR